MQNASLTVVGCGIKFLSHLTTETKSYVRNSDKVLYLVNEPAIAEWIQKENPHAESLDRIYSSYKLRQDCYQGITNYILEQLRLNQHLCVVMYGHPTVFAQPALEAVNQAKKEGYYAKILPGISAEDCLFADLLIDPGQCGCQSFEATDFLIYRRYFDASSHLILWQVSVIGALHHPPSSFDNTKGLHVLREYLYDKYPSNHRVILYEAAQYPMLEPRIQELTLEQLPEITCPRISTLYVPPSYKKSCDETMLESLGVVINYLK